MQVGKTARYDCATGYKLEGMANDVTRIRVECIGNTTFAEWEGPRPNCERRLKEIIK